MGFKAGRGAAFKTGRFGAFEGGFGCRCIETLLVKTCLRYDRAVEARQRMIMRSKVPGDRRVHGAAGRTLGRMKLFAPVLLICLALAGCGGDDAKKDAASTPAATQAATEAPSEVASSGSADEGEVTAMFNAYLKSLVDRDWDAACSHLAPETTEKLKANIQQLGVTDVPDECAALMGRLYAQIDKDPNAKKTIDDIAGTAKVKSVKLDGEKASITWSAKVNGVDTPVTQSARMIDGEWKLIDVN